MSSAMSLTIQVTLTKEKVSDLTETVVFCKMKNTNTRDVNASKPVEPCN